MSQSKSQIYLHIVFSTRERRLLLKSKDHRVAMHAYLAGACNNLGCPALVVGGVEDHVHILCRFGRGISISDLIRDLKRESSKWFKEKFPPSVDFYWQSGYGVFSLSPSHVEAVRQYIVNQEEHHRRETFQDEFRRLCVKYGLEIDERYVWD